MGLAMTAGLTVVPATRPGICRTSRRRVGDLMLWDNRCLTRAGRQRGARFARWSLRGAFLREED